MLPVTINRTSASSNSLRINGLTIYYTNKQAAEEIYEEVFHENLYDFETQKTNPFIIDAGCNIGISTLFFKKKYPLAKVLCFEPDPNAFAILQKNITVNHLRNIKLVNAALSNKTGFTEFYGEVSGTQPDSRGNSIVSLWGNQRETSIKILVKTVQLSSYINSEVDFLKIDIEAAEQQVLKELGKKLKLIKKLSMEVHEAKKISSLNNVESICQLLKRQNFEVEVTEQGIIDLLPQQIKGWIEQVDPKFYILKAEQKYS